MHALICKLWRAGLLRSPATDLGDRSPGCHPSCGDTITQSTVLQNDVGPCTNSGITVGANGITFDLNGHRIFGSPNPGDGFGVYLLGRTGVTVKNGTVSSFDGGVVIVRASRNVVRGNQVTRNGFYRVAARRGNGIGMQIGGADDNVGEGNYVTQNADNGIVIRNGSPRNTVRNNRNRQRGAATGLDHLRAHLRPPRQQRELRRQRLDEQPVRHGVPGVRRRLGDLAGGRATAGAWA